MNPRAIVLAVAAVLVVGVTVFLMKSFLGRAPTEVVKTIEVKQTQILVAKTTLPTGQFIDQTNVTWAPWPDKNVPPSYFQDKTTKIPDLVGSVVRRGIAAGDPITAGRLVRAGERGFVAAVLRPGFRAISIPINAQTGVSGLIFPGDHVDIILIRAVGGKRGQQVGETIIEDVRIVAIDQRLGDTGEAEQAKVGRTVTLEVPPKLAESLAVAQKMGTLTLSLRSLAKGELPALARTEDLDYADPRRGNSHTSANQVSRIGEESASSVQVIRGQKSKAQVVSGSK